MDSEKQYLSKEKYEELEKELDYLKNVKRQEATSALDYAKSLGDLTENAEYHAAREEQAAVEDQIAGIEHMLKSAEIVSSSKTKKDTAAVGATVEVRKENGEVRVFKLVGSVEADSGLGKISNHSPLGQALLGKKKGDDIKVSTPSGEVKYTVIDVK